MKKNERQIELEKELDFVKGNISSMYEWVCTMEDSIKRFKRHCKKLMRGGEFDRKK